MMQDLNGRVAVITGAASGIGNGIAHAFAQQGMRLVLADIEAERLEAAAAALRQDGATVMTQLTDVSQSEQVEALALAAYAEYGVVNVVCNNAGVIENNAPAWEYTLSDWDWVLGINLMGVVHGVRSFIPRMLQQGAPGHVVNTASLGGLVAGSAAPIYIVSKHAVVALSECVYNSLSRESADVNISVLCPGWVQTDIADSDRNRVAAPNLSDTNRRSRDKFRDAVEHGLAAQEVGELVVRGIKEPRFYLLTHPQWNGVIEDRFRAISDGRKPAATRMPSA